MISSELRQEGIPPRHGEAPASRSEDRSVARREQSNEGGTGSVGESHPHNILTKSARRELRVRSEPTREEIREMVCKRAAGLCEAGCGTWVGEGGEDGHLDHRFGRGKGRPEESVTNCWLLCVACDAERTKPSKTTAAYWWGRFILHAQRYGYEAEAQLASLKIDKLKAKGFAEVSR